MLFGATQDDTDIAIAVKVRRMHALRVPRGGGDDVRSAEDAISVVLKPADSVVVIRSGYYVLISIAIHIGRGDNAGSCGTVGDVQLSGPRASIVAVPGHRVIR